MSELKDRGTHKNEAAEAKRHFERLGKQQDRTVEDKDHAARLAKKLRLDGTREGVEKIDGAVTESGKVLDELLEAQERSHDRAASREANVEERLHEQADSSDQDARTARREGARLQDPEARRQVEEAADGAEEDERFLKEVKKRRAKEREHSEAETRKRVEKAQRTEVKTKRTGADG